MFMESRRFTTSRAAISATLVLFMVLGDSLAFAQRRGGGGGARGGGGRSYSGGSRGSVSSANRGSATTSRTNYGGGSTRTTEFETRSGNTGTATRNVSKSGDEINVNRNVQSSSGASKTSSKTYDMGADHRVESVERNTSVTGRSGQTANYQGKAEREDGGWEFSGEGTNRYGQKVDVEGFGARGPYGSGVVADVEGGRYGDRTVAAGRGYGGPVYARQLPAGYRPYNYYGHSYYGYGGAYYRPYYYGGYPYYGYMWPPWGVYYASVPVGAIALTVAGTAMLYSEGTYYSTTYVEGATQYQVVAPPEGTALPAGTSLPADRATVTLNGTTYYIYGNSFYRRVDVNGKETYQVVTRPAGLVTVKALPDDFEPMQAGSILYFRSKGRFYLPYLDPSGDEFYIVVDQPPNAVKAVPAGEPGAAPTTTQPKAGAAAPAAKAGPPAPQTPRTTVTLTAPVATPVTVRVSTEINSGKAQAGFRFQGNLDNDLLADGRIVAVRGTRAYGRVAEAKSGTGTGGDPLLVLELTDLEINGRIVPIKTEAVRYTAEGKKAGKKVLGGAALGAGIGGMIDGGSGAAIGAGIGAVAGVAAASSAPGNQVAVATGTAIEFRLAQPIKVDIIG